MKDVEQHLARWGVSRETIDRLDIYGAQLAKWQQSINLVGPETLVELWPRHIIDSLQLLPLLEGKGRIVDLGSGAGLPGMVLAIALAENQCADVRLVESNAKKAAFLRHISMLTEAKAQVMNQRLEQAIPALSSTQVITARALAPLTQLLKWCEPLLKSGAMALFHKGRDLQIELDHASRYWDIDYSIIPSVVTEQSFIVQITTIRARNGGRGTDI